MCYAPMYLFLSRGQNLDVLHYEAGSPSFLVVSSSIEILTSKTYNI